MVCVTCVWAGVDRVWAQEKPEARKILAVGVADSLTSGAALLGGFAMISLVMNSFNTVAAIL